MTRRLCCTKLASLAGLVLFFGLATSFGQIRDGGIDPWNLGKGDWIYSIRDATNQLGGHVAGVTNENSLMQFYHSQGIRYVVVKTGTGASLYNGCYPFPQLTPYFINTAHNHGVWVFGYNRSYGTNVAGEVAIADFVFNQGADGFVWDAEAEWESGALGTQGPALAWQQCSQVRSNWPNKFLAHAPFPIIYFHASFPYKEFGFWCDAVMPQIYHFSSSGLKGSPSAAINWSDVNWRTWQSSLAGLPIGNSNGVLVNWTNAIKPIVPLQDVYGPTIPGGIICNGTAAAQPDEDVQEFIDYCAADPHAQTVGGYQGASFWRTDLHGAVQWSFIKNGTPGNFAGAVNNLVLDDARARVVGGWTAVRVFGATTTLPTYYGATGSDTNSFGTNYFSKLPGNGSAYVQFTPNIAVAGDYDVYEWHPYVTNAASATPFVIHHATGTTTVLADQRTNSGKWSLLGRFNFAAGTNGSIRVQDNFSEPGHRAIADGVKLAFAPPLVPSLTLDNTNAAVTFTAGWSTGTSSPDKYLGDYRFASTANGGVDTAVFRPDIVTPGYYDVSIWYPQGGNRATNAPWTVTDLGGSVTIPVDQTSGGGGWHLLAAARLFTVGTNGYVRLSNDTGYSGRVVLADAVRFDYLGPYRTPPVITLQPQSQDVKAWSNVTFTVTASSDLPLAYQWRFNGAVIAAATNATYLRPLVTTNDAGSYSVVVTNLGGSVVSDAAVLTVRPPAAPKFASVARLPDGRLQLGGNSDPGTVTIASSANLVTWQDRVSFSVTNGGFLWVDSETNAPQRFYRARLSP